MPRSLPEERAEAEVRASASEIVLSLLDVALLRLHYGSKEPASPRPQKPYREKEAPPISRWSGDLVPRRAGCLGAASPAINF